MGHLSSDFCSAQDGIPRSAPHSIYKRHGTTTLFAALNMLDGTIIGECMPRHRQRELDKVGGRHSPKGCPRVTSVGIGTLERPQWLIRVQGIEPPVRASTALARFSHTAIPGSPASPARRGAGAGFDARDDIVVKPIA